MKTEKAKKVKCSKFEPETKETCDCEGCSNLDGEIQKENGETVKVFCVHNKAMRVNPPKPEQLSALTVQRVVPDKKILEVGHKAKEESTLDAFDPERRSAEALKVKNLNLF